MNQGALACVDDDAVLSELASGVWSKDIASRYGVTPYALRKRLAKHPDYKDAIAEQSQAHVESTMDEVMNVPLDAVAIARARVKVDSALKYARAHNPAYADKQEITHELGESFDALIAAVGERRRAKQLQQLAEVDVTPVANVAQVTDT